MHKYGEREVELPFTEKTYVIIRVWHSNAPRLFHTQFIGGQKRKRDFGHVSLDTYVCQSATALTLGESATYQSLYMSLWEGSDTGISTEQPFSFIHSFDEDIRALGRMPDLAICLERLSVAAINQKYKSIYDECNRNPDDFQFSILNAWSLSAGWDKLKTILAAICLCSCSRPKPKYCCSTLTKELLEEGGISTYFEYFGIPCSERLSRGFSQGFNSSALRTVAILSATSAMSFFYPTKLLSTPQNDDVSMVKDKIRGGSASEVAFSTLFQWGIFLLNFLMQALYIKELSVEPTLETNSNFTTFASSVFLASARSFVCGFVFGCLNITFTRIHSPSSIADLALSAQKREEVMRLSKGDTRSENISSRFLKLINYQ